MFALAVELLAGRYVATAYNNRDRVEWPPHPARLFSALVATWADGDADTADGQLEAEALRWLECQSAPQILASGTNDTARRVVCSVFVPVNDVFTVTAPDRSKLDASLAEEASAGSPKLAKEVTKLTSKLLVDTAKAVSVPRKLTREAIANAESTVFADRRAKQPRTFPSATPAHAVVAFVWSEVEPSADHIAAFERLLSRLVRLGHSSTLVRAQRVNGAALEGIERRTTRYHPDSDEGELVVRWVSPGQMDRLARAFEKHAETEPHVLPAHFVRYTEREIRVDAPVEETVFDPDNVVVFSRVGGPRLPIISTAGLSRQFRRALMSVAQQPVPELLSGHRLDGAPSEHTHMAVVPLPFVGRQHADGAILGLTLFFPRACDPEQRRAVLKAVGLLELEGHSIESSEEHPVRLHLGQAGTLELERVRWGEPRSATLNPARWCKASRAWASVTPIALDRNPGDLHDSNAERRRTAFVAAEQSIRDAVSRILPAGVSSLVRVDVVRSCVVAGTAKPRNYPRFPIDDRRHQRVLVHVRLVFDRPVRGPILLGAGRYQGLGLCLPVDLETEDGTVTQ